MKNQSLKIPKEGHIGGKDQNKKYSPSYQKSKSMNKFWYQQDNNTMDPGSQAYLNIKKKFLIKNDFWTKTNKKNA